MPSLAIGLVFMGRGLILLSGVSIHAALDARVEDDRFCIKVTGSSWLSSA